MNGVRRRARVPSLRSVVAVTRRHFEVGAYRYTGASLPDVGDIVAIAKATPDAEEREEMIALRDSSRPNLGNADQSHGSHGRDVYVARRLHRCGLATTPFPRRRGTLHGACADRREA